MPKLINLKWIPLLALIVACSTATLFSQNEINWLSWEEAMELSKTEDKKILVDMYTKWCGWCKKMDRSTFRNPYIVEYINNNYIPVRFDAEQKQPLEYKGEVYNFKSTTRKGYHELAAKITGNNLRYPSLVFLDENQEVIQSIPGFQNSISLEIILSYIRDNHYTKTPWHHFLRTYQSNQGDSQLVNQKGKN